MKIKNSFKNPFEIYNENKLLVVGLLFFILTSLFTYSSDILLFGSLKIVNLYKQTIWMAIINLAITVVANWLALFVYSKISYTKTRWIDVLNVILIAYIPIYLLAYISALPIVEHASMRVELAVLDSGFNAPNIALSVLAVLVVFGFVAIASLVYFFYLLIVGTKIAINSKRKYDGFVIIILILVINTILQILNPFLHL